MEIEISCVIIARNEEELIADCINWHKPYVDDFVLVDGGSSDRTRIIAEGLGAHVLVDESQDFSHLRNEGMIAVRHDWVLFVDADERFDREFLSSMKVLISQFRPLAFRVNRRNLDPSDKVKIGDYQVRLINRRFCVWKMPVHEVVYDRYSENLIDQMGSAYVRVEDRPIIHLPRTPEFRAVRRKHWDELKIDDN